MRSLLFVHLGGAAPLVVLGGVSNISSLESKIGN